MFKQDYPYIATGGICQKSSCDVVPGTGVDKWIDVGTTEEVGAGLLDSCCPLYERIARRKAGVIDCQRNLLRFL